MATPYPHRLRALRWMLGRAQGRKRISQTELGALMGISPDKVSRIERGAHIPTGPEALGLDVLIERLTPDR